MSMNIHYETKLGEPSPEALALPYSPLLPKDTKSLLKLRYYVRARCVYDLEFRAAIDQMCSEDLPFFVLVFGWMHETRGTEDQFGEFPVVLDPDQIDILAWWQKWSGKIDITDEKTRGIGFSYLACFLLLWIWLYNKHNVELGMLTKDEGALDKKDKPGTLMGKLDLLFKHLPSWMRRSPTGKHELVLQRLSSNQNHIFRHRILRNTVTGYVPTNEKLRSDRLYLLVADEGAFLDIDDQQWLAAAYGTVNSVLWISTHKGTANLFYRMTRDTESRLVRISSWWWNNVRCRRGLYRIVKGRVEILDPDYDWPVDYFNNPKLFKLEEYIKGRVRSPWVDRQFLRPGIEPLVVIEELYGLSALQSRKLLRDSVIKSATSTAAAKPPLAKGYLREGEWVDDPEGDIWLWFNPAYPPGLCIIGVDPALTEITGAYFAATAVNFKTGEQVLSYRSRSVSADEFPGIICGIGRWLAGGGALPPIACESQGPAGKIFLTGVERLRYKAVAGDPNKTTPGFGNNDRGVSWITEWGRAVRSGEHFVRDPRLADDADGYEFDEKWELVFTGRDGHGDLLIADSIAWHVAKVKRLAYMRAQKRAVDVDPDETKLARRRAKRSWSDRFRAA